MTQRSLVLTTLFVASLFAAGANAHDPALHDYTPAPAPAAKAKPSSCEELADTQNYSADLADKSLKAGCTKKAEKAEKTEPAKTDGKDD